MSHVCSVRSPADTAAAAAAVLAGGDERVGQAYDLTGPELLTGPQLADLFAWVGARAVKATPVDDRAMVAFMVGQGLPEEAAEIWATMGKAIREGALNQVTGDGERLTGRKPATVRQVLEAAHVGLS